MSVKKILFINDYKTGGGAEVVLHQLMEGLSAAGFEVRLFYGLEENHAKTGNPLSYIYSLTYRRKLARILGEFQPDTVHLLNYYHILTPSVLDALKGFRKRFPLVKVLYTAHDFHLLSPNSGLTSFSVPGNRIVREEPVRFLSPSGESLLSRRWDHRGLMYSILKVLQWQLAYGVKKADSIIEGIICPGKFMFSVMKRAFPDKNVVLIRNPYLPPEAGEYRKPPLKTKDPLKKGNGSPLRFVFAGRIAQEKGIIPFVKGVSKGNWEKIELHVFGTGPQSKELKNIISNLGLEDRCFLYGTKPHSEIIETLSAFDALLLPSLWFENAPLSIAEAAFAGLRILVSDWGGIKAMAEFCGGEYLFNPENPKDTNGAIERIVSDAGNNVPLKRDYEKLKEAFSFGEFIKMHTGLYRDSIRENISDRL